MAHFARINQNNIVTFVTVVDNSVITDENGVEHEERAFDLLYTCIPESTGDRWVQTSYGNNFRKRYAAIGYTYDEQRDAFIPPKPYNSWILNEDTCDWEPPVPMPEEFKDTIDENGKISSIPCFWDETTLSWKEIDINSI